jgi:hypothetical protein
MKRARFQDIISLTVVRPGEIASAEWSDFDVALARWTIPAKKMKMEREHVVLPSRQALAILEQVARLTRQRQFVFSCSSDDPISDDTLCKRLRDLGYDTATKHCAHGFRTHVLDALQRGHLLDDSPSGPILARLEAGPKTGTPDVPSTARWTRTRRGGAFIPNASAGTPAVYDARAHRRCTATGATSVCGISRANAGDDGENGRDQKSSHLFSSKSAPRPTVVRP